MPEQHIMYYVHYVQSVTQRSVYVTSWRP